ncbi:MAG TPA: hypothetical protein VIK48_06805 [Candidatus Manganitrophaceae bacterium]
MKPEEKTGRFSFPQKLTLRDRLMLVNMVLFFVIGCLILYRALSRNGPWLAHGMGVLFISTGGYRLYLLRKALKGVK